MGQTAAGAPPAPARSKASMELLNSDQQQVSTVFTIPTGGQVTLNATGLSDLDSVVVEIVQLSSGLAFTGDPCDAQSAPDIEVVTAVPLRCPNGSPVNMNKEFPYVVLDAPQQTPLRVRIVSELAVPIVVTLNNTTSAGALSFTCREVYCASMPVSCENDSGFGYHVVEKDPLATVEMVDCDNGDSIWIYPEAGRGHTMRITDCEGTLIGYANNCSCNCGCN
jgi:hypothetical protein